MKNKRPRIVITNEDARKLSEFVASPTILERDREHIGDLEEELARAEVVPPEQMPDDVITMNTTFCLRNLDTDKLYVFTLVYPADADIAQGKLSILAPIGIAVLGFRVSDVFDWTVPSGKRRFRVEGIVYQPEAHGLI